MIRALADTAVPVPQAFAFCDDAAVNGAPFYVMSNVDGVILRTPADMAELTAAQARACSEALVDVLAAIHAVDYAGRARRLRAPRRLPRAPGAALGRAVGTLEGDRASRDRRARAPAARRARVAAADDRARRLPARQHDARARRSRPRRRGARLGDVDARRSARRSRALPALLGPGRRAGDRDRRGHRPGEGLPHPRAGDRPVRVGDREPRSTRSTGTKPSRPTSSRSSSPASTPAI